MSLVNNNNNNMQTNLLSDVMEAQNLDEKRQFLEAVRKYLVCLKSLSDKLLIESYLTGLQMSDTSLGNVNLCVMLSERIKDILTDNKRACSKQCDQSIPCLSSSVENALKLNQNLMRVHKEKINRFFDGNKNNSLNMNLMLQRKMSENIAIAEKHRMNLEKKRDEQFQQIIEETERKFSNHGCLSEYEIHQKKVFSDVLKFELDKSQLEGLRATNKESIDEKFIYSLIERIFRTEKHPLKVYFQGEQFKICFKIKEILDKAKNDPKSTDKLKDETLLCIRRNYKEVVKMFVFVYEQLDDAEKMSALNKCLEQHFFGSVWDFLKDLYRLSLGSTEGHLSSLMEFCKSIKFNPACIGVPENFQLVQEMNPYHEAITNFSSVVRQQPLSSKLIFLSNAFHCICSSVKQYSHTTNVKLPEIGADELLPILSYCLIASNTPTLLIDCHILMDLTDDSQLLGENGYCLASVLTALDWLSKLNVDINNGNLTFPNSDL